MKQRVYEKFDKLDPLEKVGITYLKFLLGKMFCMTNDIVPALQKFLKSFAEEVLSKTVGENVSEATAQFK